jgi:hypothetical protein
MDSVLRDVRINTFSPLLHARHCHFDAGVAVAWPFVVATLCDVTSCQEADVRLCYPNSCPLLWGQAESILPNCDADPCSSYAHYCVQPTAASQAADKAGQLGKAGAAAGMKAGSAIAGKGMTMYVSVIWATYAPSNA